MQLDLPTPSTEEIAQSQKLVRLICSQTPMSFADFMQMALYQPRLGYYMTDRRKLGSDGDFITAPEVSSLFGIAIARQITPVLAELSRPEIIEFGAGTGSLAVDILTELKKNNALPFRYKIIELSPDLKAIQQERIQEELPQLFDRVKWLTALPESPVEAVILANEVVDAMPVERFRITNNKLMQGVVHCHQDQLTLGWQPANTALQHAFLDLNINPRDGFESELNLYLVPWIRTLNDALTRGLILLIDYGYTAKELVNGHLSKGTLLCHYRHHAHDDVFWLPGCQDITTHVNFSYLAKAGRTAGLDLKGYTHQAAFLLNSGIEEQLQQHAQNQNADWFKTLEGFKRLVLPEEMGARFRVIAFGKNLECELTAFKENLAFLL